MSCEFEFQKLDGKLVLFTIQNCMSALDGSACDHLKNTIDDLEKDGYVKYIFNLQYLELINSSFVGLIAKRHYTLNQKGGRIAILKAQDMVSKSFEISGLGDMLPFFSDQEEAINSFKD